MSSSEISGEHTSRIQEELSQQTQQVRNRKNYFCRKSRPGPEPSDRDRKSSGTGRGLPVNCSTPIVTAFETVLNRLWNRFKPFAGTKGSKYYCPLFCACSCACADTCDCPPKFPHQRGNATEPGTTKHLGEHKGIWHMSVFDTGMKLTGLSVYKMMDNNGKILGHSSGRGLET